MTLFDYFGRVEIIHLPERADRYAALKAELASVGFDIERANIPLAPRPQTAYGFPSRGVYGNFLSHLDIIKRAYSDGLESILILEDDAIFSRRFAKRQNLIIEQLARTEWDIFYVGHSVSGLAGVPSEDIASFNGPLVWAHCYAINRTLMPRLIDYLSAVIETPSGDIRGGKMYIDGAYAYFRQLNPEVRCFVTSPCASVQKGSRSDLGSASHNYFPKLVAAARSLRDECWRLGLIKISSK